MVFYWGILIWVISNAYARDANNPEYAARSIEYVESVPPEVQDGDDLGRSLENGVMRRQLTCSDGYYLYRSSVCRRCKVCSGMYTKLRSCYGSRDTVCHRGSCRRGYYGWYPWCRRCTKCRPGWRQVRPCGFRGGGGTYNTVCVPLPANKCSRGYYLSDSSGTSHCRRCKRCRSGYYQSKRCRRRHDTVCKPRWPNKKCPSGYYVMNNRCKRCTTCHSGLYVAIGCSRTADTVCMRVNSCLPGFYHRNHCRRCTSCLPGYFELRPCSRHRNRICKRSRVRCSPGYYNYQNYCRRCTSCTSGYYAIRPCNANRDVICQRCKRKTRNPACSRLK